MSERYKISRSKIDLFLNCPRCFYLDVKLGVKRPSFPAFTLNSAVDHLLKKEFDIHRAKGTRHPLCDHYKLSAVPFQHPDMEKWRHNFTGIQHLHEATDILVFGAVDDIWVDEGELMIVDYKATAKDKEIRDLDDSVWHDQYRRQMEIYQWLFKQNGFKVSDTGYFVYANGRKDKKAFDGKLEFAISLIPYKGDSSWVPKTLEKIRETLDLDTVPEPSVECEYCEYRRRAQEGQGSGGKSQRVAPLRRAYKK